ncbi:mannitol dehydrogenase family protein [Kineosporia succinea]|uniref:Mannitol-1-phosphate 5-dehydrogenase n=1 Tax=Kineosporia succinea TaxID=84632 RepID=A0ABT9PGS6_9ACTN|nr:mannitol dehydrogenase family protein [Kineosporia succinea]MDP9831140.1 fructuronate reductase [Kineosporia succinea]
MTRLTPATAPPGTRVRAFGPSAPVGIVHLGIGAFHRAHQAVYTQEADPDGAWGICGVTQRSATVAGHLRPQDGLYTVLQRDADHTRADVVSQVHDVIDGSTETGRLTERLADPRVQVVTLTVTEKGYRPGGAVGRLIDGLQARRRADAGPVTVLSCDNLSGNGEVLSRLVLDHRDDDLAAWAATNVRFPSSMVDRIVPATTPADRDEVARRLGVDDAGLVVAEPFRQWVIEDRFAAARPAWEKAGAELVTDVAPYERRKLRVLNGTHSLLAYLGALAGYPTIAEAVADDSLAGAAWQLIEHDVAPTLAADGLDVTGYGRTVLERFANPALRHRTVQVAMDGTQKLGPRLLGTIRDARAVGHLPRAATLAVAAWMVYVERATTENDLPLDDPQADVLREAVGSSSDLVAALLSLEAVFGADLPEDREFRALLGDLVAQVRAGSIR